MNFFEKDNMFHNNLFHPTHTVYELLRALGFSKFEIWFIRKFGHFPFWSKFKFKYRMRKMKKKMHSYYDELCANVDIYYDKMLREGKDE